jgi:hypothetical protein
VLFRFQILFSFEQQPARLLQHRHASIARYAAGFSGTDLIQRLVQFRHDVKAIDTDRIDLTQHSVLRSESDDVFHRVENLSP